jgi:hypothetical protein
LARIQAVTLLAAMALGGEETGLLLVAYGVLLSCDDRRWAMHMALASRGRLAGRRLGRFQSSSNAIAGASFVG